MIDESEVKLDNEELKEYCSVTPWEALKIDLAESYGNTIKNYLEFLNSAKSMV